MGNTHVNLSAETLDTSTKYLRQDSIDDVKAIFQKLQTKQKDSAKHSIDRNTFGTFFRYDSKITDNLFNTFDQDGNGTIDSDEFLRGMALCSSGSLDSKIKFCFNAYDASGDGNLQKKELEGMLVREKRMDIFKKCLTFLDTRVELDQSGFKFDIFEH